MSESRQTIRINRTISASYWVCLGLTVLGAAACVTGYMAPWEFRHSVTGIQVVSSWSVISVRGTLSVHVARYARPNGAPASTTQKCGLVWRRDIKTISYPLFVEWQATSRYPVGFDIAIKLNLIPAGIIATIMTVNLARIRRRRKLTQGFEITLPTGGKNGVRGE